MILLSFSGFTGMETLKIMMLCMAFVQLIWCFILVQHMSRNAVECVHHCEDQPETSAEECRPDLQLVPQIQLNLLLIAKLIDVGYEVVLNKPDVAICNYTKGVGESVAWRGNLFELTT